MRKTISGLLLPLLMLNMLTLAFNIQPVKASGTIYIRADGSIDPPTAPISTIDNSTYTLTDDIDGSIVIGRNDITVNGAGYLIQGSGALAGSGISLPNVHNVVIEDCDVKYFTHGIYLSSSYYCTIIRSSVANNDGSGISLVHSSGNTVTENVISSNNNYGGIWLNQFSDNNVITGNNISNNAGGIYLGYFSCGNTVFGNNLETNIAGGYQGGITLSDHSDNNTISENTVKDSGNGIAINVCCTNNVSLNKLVNNALGLYNSSFNSVTKNNLTNSGMRLSYYSERNTVYGNTITDNGWGIWLWISVSDNNIYENKVENNSIGIRLEDASANRVYHNSFSDNAIQVHSSGSLNVWDDGYPSGGNYWSDYAGVDINGDGIGDTPYVIDANNQDRYPLISPWTPTSPWPMFMHDLKHTGVSPYLGPQTNETIWIIHIPDTGILTTSPVIGSDGTIYVGGYVNGRSKFYAVYPNGTVQWIFDQFGDSTPTGIPAIGRDGAIYFATSGGVNYNGRLMCLNPNGTLRWLSPEQALSHFYEVDTGLAIGTDQTIYISACVEERLIAVNSNGTVKWIKQLGARTWSSPAIADDGTIYVAQDLHKLFAFNPDGSELWSITLRTDLAAIYMQSPAIGEDGTIYLADYDKLYAVTPNGEIKWTVNTPIEGQIFEYSSPAIGENGMIYVAVTGGGAKAQFCAINPNGTFDWIFNTDDDTYIYSSPAIGNDGTIYFGSYGGNIYALNSDGSLKWKYETGRQIACSLAIGLNGLLIIADRSPDGSNLYAFGQTQPQPPPNIPPIAKFSYSPSEPNVGYEITFDASDSHDPDGSIVSYDWDFGDGNTGHGNIATHSYSSAGDYTASLTVTDDKEAASTATKVILVATVLPNQSPHAFFIVTPGNPKQGQETKLDASSSSDSDGAIKYYEWDLDGDGTYDGFTTSSKIYYFWEESGTYNVRLRVTDDDEATDVFTKSISIQKYSFWEKAKRLLALTVEELSETEKQRFMKIKSELHISNYPHSSDPLSDTDFYWYCDDQLIQVLKKKVDPDKSDLTYETTIFDILHDMEFADSVANRPWTANPVMEAYFQNMADINAWADAPLIMLEELAEGLIEKMGGMGIGVGSVLSIWDVSQALLGREFLDDTFYRRALWHYFELRRIGYSAQDAYESSPIPIKYDSEATRNYFEELWGDYGGFNISEYGGLKTDFKEQIIEELRTLLISGLETYKFEPIQRYKIKSPAQLRIYDSIGRVTGLVNYEIKEQIPNSIYDNETETVLIYPANDTYRCQIVGLEQGTYTLEITYSKDGKATTFGAIAIPTTNQATHLYIIDWSILIQGQQGVTVQVDSEGDGFFEHVFVSDDELTQIEFLSQIAPPLSVSISPLSASIILGQSVTFTSTVSGGITPYSYQWYLNGNPVLGATSNTWSFTPTTSGIYYIYLKATDAIGNTTQSETARITVATVPVGGYSFPIQVQTKTEPIIPYIALIATLTAIFVKLKPKTKRKH